MSVRLCEECGRLFGFLPRGVCADCLDEREADFRVVREWLRRNAGASVIDVAAATGVREPRISHFLREGRLSRLPGGDDARVEDERRRRAAIPHAAPAGAPAPVRAAAPAPARTGGLRARQR